MIYIKLSLYSLGGSKGVCVRGDGRGLGDRGGEGGGGGGGHVSIGGGDGGGSRGGVAGGGGMAI